MNFNNSSQVDDYDEIDLFELVENLWSQRLLITMFSVCSVFLGYCYTIIAPEKWTAEIYIADASPLQIDPLNPPELAAFSNPEFLILGRRERDEIAPEITPVDLMESFTSEIRSVSTLMQFDAERAESIFKNSDQLSDEERIAAANGFLENMLKVTLPVETTDKTSITLTLDSPDSASSVLSDYVQFVSDEIVRKRKESLKLAISRAIQTNEFEIERAKRSYIRKSEEGLALLELALRIAQAAGVKDNQSGLFIDEDDDNRLTGASKLYLRGERLLKAEINALRASIGSSALIPEVRSLEATNELLRDIVIDAEEASAIFIEKPATPPAGRDSPNTKLVLALALVLGGLLGILTALVRRAVRNSKSRQQAKT